MAGISLSTLGDLRDNGVQLYASCTAQFAGHGAWLDLDMLIERYGAGYRLVGDERIERACVCRQCGHRGATLRLHPDSRPTRPRDATQES